jgi:putative flippase GtrA
VGLGITTGIVGVGSRYGLDPRVAKGIAIIVSFQATYIVRRKVVFA